ncbi:MAG: hypothetical protein B7C54_08555 [Acidimicrobiales bacterium mtb01]|nr:hypothetical protein [Actinomycetota bacterium]TEX45159.1 MAG: hypothetical protein B7C54_08555 [Acidimicrobiales bacterium mtb01]
MSRRIEIELTSSRPDGTWTWRAAGAREPKGVLDGTILPSGSKTGDVMKVDAEFDIDGIEILSVVQNRAKANKVETITLISDDRNFQPVTQQLARRDKRDGRDGRDGRSGDRRGDRRDRRPRGEGESTDRRPRGNGERPARPNDGERRERRPDRPRRPRFEAPPELPQRPRAKRLKSGSAHRKEVLATIPENQRPIAELALQGMQAVRQKLKTANEALAAEGKPTMPEQTVLQMAQDLLPKLRVADWLDRAEAAKRDLDQLDLRDLRSVVAAANDPVIERDEACRPLVADLRAGLVTRTETEHQNWLADITAAVEIGRVVRALKLAGQPPKAGAIFPEELGRKLAEVTAANLTPDAFPDRWIAVLEAVAFSPVRSLLTVSAPPTNVTPELTKTVERLASLLPSIAALFGVVAAGKGQAPKPLRPTKPKRIPPKPPTPTAQPSADTAPAPAVETPAAETPAVETPAAETAGVEAPAVETPAEGDTPA